MPDIIGGSASVSITNRMVRSGILAAILNGYAMRNTTPSIINRYAPAFSHLNGTRALIMNKSEKNEQARIPTLVYGSLSIVATAKKTQKPAHRIVIIRANIFCQVIYIFTPPYLVSSSILPSYPQYAQSLIPRWSCRNTYPLT